MRKDLLQLSVRSPGHITEVFSGPGKSVCCPQTRSHSRIGVGLADQDGT